MTLLKSLPDVPLLLLVELLEDPDPTPETCDIGITRG